MHAYMQWCWSLPGMPGLHVTCRSCPLQHSTHGTWHAAHGVHTGSAYPSTTDLGSSAARTAQMHETHLQCNVQM